MQFWTLNSELNFKNKTELSVTDYTVSIKKYFILYFSVQQTEPVLARKL